MTGSIRNFEKLNFTPKSSVFCFSQGQTSEYDRLAQTQNWRKAGQDRPIIFQQHRNRIQGFV